jgi:hypothetical protein
MSNRLRQYLLAGIKYCAHGIIGALLYVPASAQGVSTHSFAGCAFPDTAQAQCFNATVAIACPTGVNDAFYGQDAQYGATASTPSYTIYEPVAGKQVTVDNRTGLMWASTGSNNGNTASLANGITSCENSTFAGFRDWRLPNVRELGSIVLYGKTGTLYIDAGAFPNTASNSYWSSTSYPPPNQTNGWLIQFNTGITGADTKTFVHYVRCVRGGP